MSSSSNAQSFASHARYVPGFHFVTGTLTLIVVGWAIYRAVVLKSADAVLEALIGVVLFADFIYLRQFPLRVQDRLICLEERLRLDALVPREQRARFDKLTPDQLIALRFASDAELPTLAARVLDGTVATRSAVKAMISSWRPDMMRA